MANLIGELKRRNVFRVGAVYVVVGWIILQVVETVSDPLGLPPWTEAFFIVLMAVGLPIALLFAWAFEITPEGVKKTADVDKEASVTAATGRKLDFAIIGALVLALGYFVWESRFADVPDTGPVAAARAAEASIAVLPFTDLSPEGDQEYFTDGISEELLNVLAGIPDLRVAARTSSFQFKGENRDITDIARRLNVAHVLEGSVRKSGLRIRVTAQLIEAKTGFHMWSDTYDRELDDIFAIQDEISAAIVAALSEALGIETTAAPLVKAASSADAYNAYLLGQHLIKRRTKADIEAAIPNLERAIELDSNYAPAHAVLGLAWFLLTASSQTYGTLTLEESLGKTLPHIERALELDPRHAEAHGVMGLTLDRRERYEEAIASYEEALRLNPSLTNVRNWYASALGDLDRPTESFREMEAAYRLDPLSVLTLNNYTDQLLHRRRFDALEPVLDRLGQVLPPLGASFRGQVLITQGRAADGTIELFRGADASPGNLRLGAAAAFGLGRLGLRDEARRLWPYPGGGWPIIRDSTDYERALTKAQERFQDDPNNPDALADLAWAYFFAGDQAQAEKLAERYLGRLGPQRRAIHAVNYIFVLKAWKQGDDRGMRERLGPPEAGLDAQLAAGLDTSDLHWAKAQTAFLRGELDEAKSHAERALAIGTISARDLAAPYRYLGWDGIAEFVALRDRYEAYLGAERLKLLTVACGEDGFQSWQPLPETCAQLKQG